jgi:hypothetical protein
MGRQVEFHALPEDLAGFLDFVQHRDDVVLTPRDSNSSLVQPLADPIAERGLITIWNRRIINRLERKLVQRTGGRDYYTVASVEPTIECSPCQRVEWLGRQALVQGRIYGSFDDRAPEYERWYEALARWIRSRFSRLPGAFEGTWVAPGTIQWFLEGGILLPTFEPPDTPAWRRFLAEQDASRAEIARDVGRRRRTAHR